MKLQREIVVRVGVAAVALPIVGAILWRGGRWCAGMFALAGALASHEYYRMTELREAPLRWIGVAATAMLPVLPLAMPVTWPAVALGILATSSVTAWTMVLIRKPRLDAPRRSGLLVGGVVYIATGLVSLATLRARPDGLFWSACVLIVTWANDTGAFFGGKLLGRHRLVPTVSPGKTWEGLAAGAVAGIAAAILACRWSGAHSLRDALAIGAIAAVLGPIGDLCKSMVKRAAGVKDTGTLFFAHGGMLDRIDAVLFNAPGVLAYVGCTLLDR
jgi:phosphatidate cytidylyltransferase